MKRILLIALALVSGICSAQTFKIQNLDVLGTSTLTGLATFTVRPVFNGNTPWDSGNLNPSSFISSNNPAFTGTATLNGASLYPTAATNAALTALPSTTASTITRLGFYAAGDAPPLNYTASGSACSLNSGAGDNGSQVATSDGKCWLANFPSGPVDVREFGAKGDNSTNNTAFMQAAHNTGKVIYYSTGIFLFTNITMSAGGIVGDGESQTILGSTDLSTTNAITFSATSTGIPGPASPVFRNFALDGSPSKAGGDGILVTAPSGENSGAQFTNVTIYTFPTCLAFGAASLWAIHNSHFINYTVQGIFIANTNVADSGDSVITGSLINTAVGTNNPGIYYASSSGLKVVGNKFLGGAYGIFVGMQAGASNLADLLVNGNSIENMANAGIELSRTSGSGAFGSIEIVGNEFANSPNGIITDNSGAFTLVTIQGNIIGVSGSGAGILLNGVSNFVTGGNVIYGSGGTPTGISIGSTSSNGLIAPGVYSGLTTNLTNASGTTQVVTIP